MTLQEFIINFQEQLEQGDNTSDLDPATIFQELDDWDSLSALMVLDMIDDKMQVEMTGTEMRNCSTLEELYDIIQSKK